jgi:hypothetical protein
MARAIVMICHDEMAIGMRRQDRDSPAATLLLPRDQRA